MAPTPSRTRLAWTPALLLAILAISILNFPAQAGTITDTATREYSENFDALPTGSVPTDSWYAVTTAGTGGTNQVFSPAVAGLSGKDWDVVDGGSPYSARLQNNGPGANLCSSGQSLQADIVVPDLSTNDVREIRVSLNPTVSNAAAPANTFGLRLTGVLGSTNTANFFAHGNALALTLSANGVDAAGAVIHLQMSQVNCANTGCVLFTFTGLTGLTSPLPWCATSGDPFVGTANGFTVADTASVAAANVHVDNYDWQGAPLPAPTVASVNPSSGSTAGGTSITISGTNFRAGATATIGGVAVSGLTVASSTSITGTTGAHAAGAADVIVTNSDTQSGSCIACYTYVAPPAPTPTITNVNPATGPTSGGTIVTITGTNYVSGAAVRFGGINAASVTFTDSGHLQATTPNHANGAADVVVTNPDTQSATLSGGFTFTGTGGGTGGGGRTTITPSRTAGGGYGSSIDANGAYVLIAHHNAANQIYIYFTTDSGGTWTDRGTGGYTSTNPQAFVSATGVFTIITSLTSAIKSTDQGLTWTPITISFSGQSQRGGATDRTGETLFMVRTSYTTGLGCGGPGFFTVLNQLLRSDDFGTTWNTAFSPTMSDQISCTTGDPATPLSLDAASTTDFNIYFVRDSASSAVRLLEMRGGAQTDNRQIIDSFSGALASPSGFAASHHGTRYIIFSDGGGTTVGTPTGTTAWTYTLGDRSATGAIYAHIDAVPGTATFVQGDGPLQTGIYAWSATGLANFASVQVQGPGTGATAASQPAIYETCTDQWIAGRDQTTDHLAVYHLSTPAPCTTPVGVAASILIPAGLSSFDADYFDGSLVTSEGTGINQNKVHARDPLTLADIASDSTSCAASPVATARLALSYISYPKCDTSGNVKTLAIRNANLGNPAQASICSQGTATAFCNPDSSKPGCNLIPSAGPDIPTGISDIGSLQAAPWDWSTNNGQQGDSGGSGGARVLLSWTFYDRTNTALGVWSLKQDNNNCNHSGIATVLFGHGQPAAYCSWRNTETTPHADFLAAADGSGLTSSYSVLPDTGNPTLSSQDTAVSPSITLSGNLVIRNNIGLSCHGQQALVMASDGGVSLQNIVPPNAGSTLFSGLTSTAPTTNGVTYSADKKWGAYIDAPNDIALINACATGANYIVGTYCQAPATSAARTLTHLTAPSTSAIIGLIVDGNGQNLWLGQTDRLTRYDIHPSTTVIQLSPGTRTNGTNPDGTPKFECNDASGATTTNCNGTTADSEAAAAAQAVINKGKAGPAGGIGGKAGFFGLDLDTLSAQSGMSKDGFIGLLVTMVLVTFGGTFALIFGGVAGAGGAIFGGAFGGTAGLAFCLFNGLIPIYVAVLLFMCLWAGFIGARRYA